MMIRKKKLKGRDNKNIYITTTITHEKKVN